MHLGRPPQLNVIKHFVRVHRGRIGNHVGVHGQADIEMITTIPECLRLCRRRLSKSDSAVRPESPVVRSGHPSPWTARGCDVRHAAACRRHRRRAGPDRCVHAISTCGHSRPRAIAYGRAAQSFASPPAVEIGSSQVSHVTAPRLWIGASLWRWSGMSQAFEVRHWWIAFQSV